MQRISRRIRWATTRLALVTTAGMMFQISGCGINPSALASDWTSAFVSTIISSFVNDQFGVTNTLFF